MPITTEQEFFEGLRKSETYEEAQAKASEFAPIFSTFPREKQNDIRAKYKDIRDTKPKRDA